MTSSSPIAAAAAPADPRTELRERLLAHRRALVAEMIAGGYSASIGTLLTGIAAALDALDAEKTGK
ncbi:MAG: hypothetical protein ACREE4_00245 [Stellaceae bacterium]